VTAAVAPADFDRRARNAEKQRRWREARRAQDRAQHRRAGAGDIGPAIAEGEPFTDDFDWCDAEWARLMAGVRFTDAVQAGRPTLSRSGL
jgi:hypothetical protein